MANPSNEHAAHATSVDDLAAQFVNRVFHRKREPIGPKLTKRPWETWELDEDFFKALSQWTLQNPDTSLDRILDNVQDGLENFKDSFVAIPDSPFPARSLVTALAHLLNLGITVRRAQKEVQNFAKDVVRWVGLVKSAFELAEDGQFTHRAWRDFKHMRDLVDKICLWAVERLTDGRWSRIGHGLMIQKEIREFNERIANARALFQDLSAINMARGVDAIMGKLRYLVQNQQTIIGEIQRLRKTQKTQLKRIMSEIETQKQIAERELFFSQTLNVHAIASPTYDKQGKRPCDDDTRIEVLNEIRQWKNDIRRGSPNFLWLTGDPGCGKSAVTASFARDCKDEGILWAQFFINRNNAETIDPRSYFPSIARQMADYSSEVAQAIHHTLIKQKSLADDISTEQAAYLFTSSIRKASELDPDQPVVVVIDGLDETERDRLDDTANIFSTLFMTLEAYSNVKVFISSRTENEITKSFILPSHGKHVKRVHLDTADPSSIRDVSHYIKRNLLDLVRKHDLNWDVWPGEDRSRVLGQRASGLFIWGVTAIKFIQEQLHFKGEECLDDVLNMLTADVLRDINALYMLIPKIQHEGQQDEWEFEKFRRIFGAILFLQEPLCIDDLVALLDLRKTPASRPADVLNFVRRFRTILVTGTDTVDGTTIPRIHKSVFEFITSNVVGAQFHIQSEHAHLELGMQCLAYLSSTRQFLVAKNSLSTPFRYATRFWLSHVSQAKTPGICADYRHSPSAYPYSTYPNSLSGHLEPFIDDPLWLRYAVSHSRIGAAAAERSHTWDAASGLGIPHTNNITCVIFSLDGKQIVSCSTDQTIKVWDLTTSKWIRTLVNYTSAFTVIAPSPDGKMLVSGSDDGLVCLWDYFTGAPIVKPSQGHKQPITCVAFSPEGEKIISGSSDKTCTLWNLRKGQAVGKTLTGHMGCVNSATFSASGRRACSVDSEGRCIIWDVSKGQIATSWERSSEPTCVAFSPKDDSVIAVGGWDGIEILIGGGRRWRIPGHQKTERLLFSPDGKEIIFSIQDAVVVANVGKNSETAHIIRRESWFTSSAQFSLTFSHIACAHRMNELHLPQIYTLEHDKASLKAVSIASEWMFTAPQDDSVLKFMGTLFNMREIQRDAHTAINNRRLNAIRWYEEDFGVAGSAVDQLKLFVLMDAVVVVGYTDGSIMVRERWR